MFRLLRPPQGTMEIGGHKMCSGKDGLPSSFNRTFQAYIVKGGWEEETTRLFKELAKKGDTIVDIGANIGYYTLLASDIVGSEGKVYAFEPSPLNYDLLVGNIKLNNFNNVVAVQKAVSDRNGKLEFYLNDQDMGAHTIYKPDRVGKSVFVESITLDDYFKGKESPIDIVKMDVEGAEMAVIQGMDNIIKLNKNLKIFAEFNIPWVKRAGITPEYFISQLMNYYHFSITVIQDYTKHISSSKIKSTNELMSICKDSVVNLLLERI
jgi:FkbM family methyltransferase